jgi:SAM-dependent methyltransferase
MEPLHWIPPGARSLLDVGCNVGDFLRDCRLRHPQMRIAGIDINRAAIQTARTRLPDAELHQGYGYKLPFEDNRFQCVTCIEVIEHVPPKERLLLVSEIKRVLAPGGRLVLRCPHRGIFRWLDAQNFRFRFPALYRALLSEGNRDANYRDGNEELVWHHHFTRDELIGLAGDGWHVEACHFGGLLLFPISDILRWPFYRLKWTDNRIVSTLEKLASVELGLDFGESSYGILVVLTKPN